MLTLSRFMSKPYLYKKRNIPDMANVRIISCTSGMENNRGFFIDFVVKSSSNVLKKYTCTILLDTENNITQNTKCKLRCDCPSFKYEFETMLHNNGALVGEPSSKRLPKKSTGIFACKHLISCISVLHHFNTIENITNYIKRRK